MSQKSIIIAASLTAVVIIAVGLLQGDAIFGDISAQPQR